jgi:deazaflavin-dependent oxidoreductase (nitroreductase family)
VSDEPDFLYLTTTGRVTGRPREIEIWFTSDDGAFYVIAEHGENAQWVRNLRANPAVAVRVGERRFAARARVLSPQTDAVLWNAVRVRSEAKYGWGDGLVVELAPTPSAQP